MNCVLQAGGPDSGACDPRGRGPHTPAPTTRVRIARAVSLFLRNRRPKWLYDSLTIWGSSGRCLCQMMRC
ncbi:unnamed protein product [Musa textilis]